MEPAARLEYLRSRYAAGVRASLFDAIALCAREGLPMPEWVAVNVLRIQNDIVTGRRKVSYDEEFGLAALKGPRVTRRRYTIETRAAEVGNAILDAHAAGTPIDGALEAAVAEQLELEVRQVRDCWKAYRRYVEHMDADLFVDRFTGTIPPS
jgi:hypothetical protein